jgi:hypothetical protein
MRATMGRSAARGQRDTDNAEGDMVRIPTHGPPTHPGEMILEEFLKPLGMTQTEFAQRIGVVVGDAAGFLKLTPEEAALVEMRLGHIRPA